MIIVRQDRKAFYNWDNTVGIYINGYSRTEILLKRVKDLEEPIDYPIGRYKNVENAEAAFKELIENILGGIPLVVVPTDEEIEKSQNAAQEDVDSEKET